MIYERLKKVLNFYLLTGIFLVIVIVSISLIRKYETNLLQSMNSFEIIKMNSDAMAKATSDKDKIITTIKSRLPADYYSKSNEELLLSAVDDVKANIKGCDIRVGNIEQGGDMLSLSVNIKASFDNYSMLVNKVGYLQEMTLPGFKVENILIERSEEIGDLVCKINGSFIMPAERVEGEGRNG